MINSNKKQMAYMLGGLRQDETFGYKGKILGRKKIKIQVALIKEFK